MSQTQTLWPKRITVDKRIVKILSESTYDNFPHSLKEMITNSYDADAREVRVNVDLKKEIIEIFDDGIGMSADDFDFYLRIAGQKRNKGIYTKSGRPIIGQFGVGFLSIFPFFLNYHIETKTTGSTEYLHADIPCYKYFSNDKALDINAITINGGINLNRSASNQSFTKIRLTGFTQLTKTFFNAERKSKVSKNSILNEAPLLKLKWYLEEDLPLVYEDNEFNDMFKDEYLGSPFKVNVNNEELKRRVFGKTLMRFSTGIQTMGSIKYRYFICSNNQPIKPSEATGLKIRNLNVGVGKRTTFGLGVETGGTRSRLRWLTGELHILEGLNSSIKVARDDFYVNDDYDSLKTKLVSLLSGVVTSLEEEKDVEKFIGTNTISNLNLLDKKSLLRKVDKVKTLKAQTSQIKGKSTNIYSDPPYSKAVMDIDISKFQKTFRIKGRNYLIESDRWDYEEDNFPACKIHAKTITINKNYPLFKKSKHLDIFIKMHVLMVLWLQEKLISLQAFKKLSEDILINYEEYTS